VLGLVQVGLCGGCWLNHMDTLLYDAPHESLISCVTSLPIIQRNIHWILVYKNKKYIVKQEIRVKTENGKWIKTPPIIKNIHGDTLS